MVTIEILQQEDIIENEPTIKEKIKIQGIQPSRITPINIEVGISISMTELPDIINKIKPIEKPQQEELDNYYTNQTRVFEDGDLSLKKLDIPHHIGLRVVLESVLRKYGNTSETLVIQIS